MGLLDQIYPRKLLEDAKSQYPFISQYDPVVTVGEREGDYAETWPVGETGGADYPRPTGIPLNRVGVEVFRPSQFNAADMAAEMLHIDPFANATRSRLSDLLTQNQMNTLKNESGDYRQSVQMGLPASRAIANAVDSAMRGYTVGQWPQSANQRMNYTKEQSGLLDALRSYMLNGYYPLNYSLQKGNGQ